ncbi:MAG: MFS transporter [Thermoplasmata archaeon]|nr:MFS transporter [Thermoplasmata archaeon]
MSSMVSPVPTAPSASHGPPTSSGTSGPGPRPRPSWLRSFSQFDRRIYLMGVGAFVRSSGRSASWLFLPLLLYLGYGLPYDEIGLLTAVIVPVAIAANWLGGAAADRWGRRWLSTAPPFVAAATFSLLYLYWHVSLGLLMGLWALNSLMMNLQTPAQNAVIGDVTRADLAVQGFSFQRVLSNAGFALSPALGGLLAASHGLPIVFAMAATGSALEGLLLLAFLRESRPRSSSEDPVDDAGTGRRLLETRPWRGGLVEPFRDRSLVLFGAVGFGLTLATQQFGTALSLYLRTSQSLPFDQIGAIYSLNGILVVLLQLPISLLMRKRPLSWLAVGSLLYGAAFVIFDASAGFLFDLGAMTVLTIGEDVTSPLQNSVVSGLGGSKRRGGYFGAFNVFTQASRVVAPPMGTLLLAVSATALWGTSASIAVLAAAGYLLLQRARGERFEPPMAKEAGPGVGLATAKPG